MKPDSGVEKARCHRCGAMIPMGRALYDLHVEIVADFDGYLPDLEDAADEIDRVVGQTASMSRTELEDDVHQEFTLVLCRPCMREVVHELRESSNNAPPSARRTKITMQ